MFLFPSSGIVFLILSLCSYFTLSAADREIYDNEWLCADETCKEPIALAVVTKPYTPDDVRKIPVKTGDKLRILQKPVDPKKKLMFVESLVNKNRGLLPKSFFRESKILVKDDTLQRVMLKPPEESKPDINPSATTTVIDGTTIYNDEPLPYPYEPTSSPSQSSEIPASPNVLQSTTPPSIPPNESTSNAASGASNEFTDQTSPTGASSSEAPADKSSSPTESDNAGIVSTPASSIGSSKPTVTPEIPKEADIVAPTTEMPVSSDSPIDQSQGPDILKPGERDDKEETDDSQEESGRFPEILRSMWPFGSDGDEIEENDIKSGTDLDEQPDSPIVGKEPQKKNDLEHIGDSLDAPVVSEQAADSVSAQETNNGSDVTVVEQQSTTSTSEMSGNLQSDQVAPNVQIKDEPGLKANSESVSAPEQIQEKLSVLETVENVVDGETSSHNHVGSEEHNNSGERSSTDSLHGIQKPDEKLTPSVASEETKAEDPEVGSVQSTDTNEALPQSNHTSESSLDGFDDEQVDEVMADFDEALSELPPKGDHVPDSKRFHSLPSQDLEQRTVPQANDRKPFVEEQFAESAAKEPTTEPAPIENVNVESSTEMPSPVENITKVVTEAPSSFGDRMRDSQFMNEPSNLIFKTSMEFVDPRVMAGAQSPPSSAEVSPSVQVHPPIEILSNEGPPKIETPSNEVPPTEAPSNEVPLTTGTPSNEIPLETGTPSNEVPLATGTSSNEVPLATGTPSNEVPLASGTPSNEVPLATGTPSNETPLATGTPSSEVPLATEASSNEIPLTTKTPSNEVLQTTGTPSNEIPPTNEALSNEVPLTTEAPDNEVPSPTEIPSNEVLTDVHSSKGEVEAEPPSEQVTHSSQPHQGEYQTIQTSEETSDPWYSGVFSVFSSLQDMVSGSSSQLQEEIPSDSSSHYTPETSSAESKEGCNSETCAPVHEDASEAYGILSDNIGILPPQSTIFMIITAVAIVFFSLGHYYLENLRRDVELVSKYNDLAGKLFIEQKEKEMLAEQLVTANESMTQISFDTTKYDEEISQLKALVKKYKEEKSAVEDREKETNRKYIMVDKNYNELRKILSQNKQKGERSALIVDIKNLKDSIAANNIEIASLKEQLTEKKEEVKSLNAKVMEYLEMKKQLERNVENAITEGHETAQKYQESISKLEKTIEENLSARVKLEEECMSLRKEKESLAIEKELAESSLQKFQKLTPSKSLSEWLDAKNIRVAHLAAEKKATELTQENEDLAREKNQLEEIRTMLLADLDQLNEKYEKAEKDKIEALTRLQVLSDYFKEKETQLQEELGSKEALWLQKQSDDRTIYEQMRALREENTSFKNQNEALKREILEQEASFKKLLTSAEEKAHENWVALRHNERRLKEAQMETSQLRARLSTMGASGENSDVSNKVGEVNGDVPPYGTAASPPFMMYPEFVPPPPLLTSAPSRPPPLGRISSPPLGDFTPPPPLVPYDMFLPPSPPPPVPHVLHKPQPLDGSHRTQKDSQSSNHSSESMPDKPRRNKR